MRIRFIYVLIFIFYLGLLQAQAPYRTGILPQVVLNKKIGNGWKVNNKWESRQVFYKGEWGESSPFNYQYERTDIALLLSKKIDLGHTLAGGYMIRIKENQVNHRFILQYSIVKRYTAFRFGQRFSTDQTIEKDQPLKVRLRYRIGVDWALNGQTVDPREFYFKLTNEYLGILQNSNNDLEIRIRPALGYVFTDNNKIELGLDYRIDSLIAKNIRNNFWFQIAWFIGLS